MDEKRRFRFLVAPIIFFASLAWGAWLDPDWRSYLEQGVQTLPSQPIAGSVVTLAGRRHCPIRIRFCNRNTHVLRSLRGFCLIRFPELQ